MPNRICLFALLVSAACAGGGSPPDAAEAAIAAVAAEPYAPTIDPAAFVDGVDHPFFPLVPGTVFRYRSTDGEETNVVTVTDETRTIRGIVATVVHDEVFADGELVEDTFDWYAQDRAGNVWYLGEESHEVAAGRVVSTAGSWEAGADGARPGIIMKAYPAPGDAYRQEYRPGVAEDMGAVLELGVHASVPFGELDDCIRTLDTSPLEPRALETKLYCRGVGMVLEDEGGARNELVSVERR